jgi:16S rRNA (cytosine967-C5)-methyltransferase
VQDTASQWVAAAVGARAGERVLDLCAAPGGKATAMAASGAFVVAADRRVRRAGLVAANAARLGLGPDNLQTVAADGTRSPFVPASFDRVLVDAPCTGLGSLRRRPDARWRVADDSPERLVATQQRLLSAAADLVRPGGVLVYSVCTLTRAETVGVAEAFAADHPGWTPLDPPDAPFVPWGTGALLLPQAAGTDGMAWFGWRAPGAPGDPAVPHERFDPAIAGAQEPGPPPVADLDDPDEVPDDDLDDDRSEAEQP